MKTKYDLTNWGARASARFTVGEQLDLQSELMDRKLKRRERRAPIGNQPHSGFTLTELTVVVGLLALLVVLVLPALAAGRNNNRDMQCNDNQKRLAAGWLMYASENSDALMYNPNSSGSGGPPWITGTLNWFYGTAYSYYNTNTSYLTDPNQSSMARYARDAKVFKCPADVYTPADWPVPRVRSVCMNGALAGLGGSGPVVKGHYPDGHRSYYGSGGPLPAVGRPVRTMSDLNSPGPARTFLILDEHPDSISDGAFMLDPGPSPVQEKWRSLPASYHDNSAVGISYADGHAEIHRWLEPYRPPAKAEGSSKRATFYPVVMIAWWIENPIGTPWLLGPNMVVNRDFEWLQDGMPYRVY